LNLLLVIPARGGSKGISRKNLQLVGGRPLISYAIANALGASTVDRVIVSTEDEEIAAVALAWGAEVPFVRPAELSHDHISLIPVIAHAVKAMDDLNWNPEIVVSLQPTAPLLSCESIDAGVKILLSTGCDSVASVRKVFHNHPYRVQQMDNKGRLQLLFPQGERYLQRQDLPVFYCLSGGLYVRKRRLLEKWSGNDFCLGEDRRGVEVDEKEALNIDSPMDLELFRVLIEQRG
jgi:CMP-N,N'-diacetyllegionaminic acid synthase